MQITLFILGFLLFVCLVLAHEWGHYIVAKRNGVIAEEFGLGFPPRAWGKKIKSGMILSLNWLPLGGFVKLKGEHDYDNRKGSFGAASLGAKTKILLAGVTVNFLIGIFILTFLAFYGLPKIIDNQFSVPSDSKIVRQEIRLEYVEPNSPAARAGLKNFDKIDSLSSEGTTYIIKTPAQLKTATQKFAAEKVTIKYERQNKQYTTKATLLTKEEVAKSLKTDNKKGYLGVAPKEFQIVRSTWSSPIVALGFSAQTVELTVKALGQAFAGLGSTIAGLVTQNHEARINGQAEAGSQVGGPVAIVAVLWGGGSLGAIFVLVIIAIISLTLALINVLPIPALDGGRLALTLFSRKILKRPVSPKWEEMVHGTGMAVLIGLVVLITVADVRRFF